MGKTPKPSASEKRAQQLRDQEIADKQRKLQRNRARSQALQERFSLLTTGGQTGLAPVTGVSGAPGQ